MPESSSPSRGCDPVEALLLASHLAGDLSSMAFPFELSVNPNSKNPNILLWFESYAS